MDILEKFDKYLQEEEKDCPKGYQFCPIQKKCVPIGSGNGKGPRRKREKE